MFNGKSYAAARRRGVRSGLEKKIQEQLKEPGVKAKYEPLKIEWEDLAYRKYTPDFILPNGILIESKGLFTPIDRRKHLLIKKQHPNLDIRFVFENSRRKINKISKTTYADWCDRYEFQYATKEVPDDWINEITKVNKLIKEKFIEFPNEKKG